MGDGARVTKGERYEESIGEISLLAKSYESPKVGFLASIFTQMENSQFTLLGPFFQRKCTVLLDSSKCVFLF
jgi:hypothetical protein